MSDFETNYKALNSAQKQAVDTLDGPVMVVAGPGTGKTQLLSMRVANILRSTDVNPANILCLTFTESGATAMRERLSGLIGPEAAKVAVHTFHSFGQEIINVYSDYFYRGAHFRAADELSSYEVLREIFEKLEPSNPLSGSINGEFTALRDTQKAISHLKQSGLTPDELTLIIDHNASFIDFAGPQVASTFADRLSKQTIAKCRQLLNELAEFKDEPLKLIGYEPLSELFMNSLKRSLTEAETSNSTKPLRAWRDNWLTKNGQNKFIFKDQKRAIKLRALGQLYYEYLAAMQQSQLYDFDDMILRVVHGLEVFNELRFELQERYLYVLVDEFQDTNSAQMRLLWNLTNNPTSEGRPNLMVVGDDDQAIFRFQGADISNILDFKKLYQQPKIIALTDNYRSNQPILDVSRSVITQGTERLENLLNISKQLKPHNNTKHIPEHHNFSTLAEEYDWLAGNLAKKIKAGQAASSIAVIARRHQQLQELLPYLSAHGIDFKYERQDNVLESEPVVQLELVARIITALADRNYALADSLLPELLAHPAWGILASELWQLGIKAYKDRVFWHEQMLSGGGKLQLIAEWLNDMAKSSLTLPYEQMVDHLMGSDSEIDETPPAYKSPLKEYFFSKAKMIERASDYLSYLSALSTLRRQIKTYRPDEYLRLGDFCDFIALHKSTGIVISDSKEFQVAQDAVQLLTAHKAKGLEFDTVFIVGLTEKRWGEKSRGYQSSISFTSNLPLAPAGDTTDERLRLLYVAMTRAKTKLYLSSHEFDENSKASLLLSYLNAELTPTHNHDAVLNSVKSLELAKNQWQNNLVKLPAGDMKNLLGPLLKTYALSATHLNNFLDVSRGGPQNFLLTNLLRFPAAMNPAASYGSAMHYALKLAHLHLSANSDRQPIEDVLRNFEQSLSEQRLAPHDHAFYLKKGSDSLQSFLNQRYESFTPGQIVERSFASQNVSVESARITGNIDLLDVDKAKNVIVTDYKTGKGASRWLGTADYEKIKLHKYRQQLLFYKLLIEGSRDFGASYNVQKGVLEFVEPSETGEIILLEFDYQNDELERLKQLIKAVWQSIQNFDFPDTSGYPQNYKGMLAFEDDLLK